MSRYRIQTNLSEIDPCDVPDVLTGLAQSLGLDPVPLRKAMVWTGGKHPDPRFPELAALIEYARRDWRSWREELIAAVAAVAGAGQLLDPATETALAELFTLHQERFVLKWAGYTPHQEIRRQLVSDRLVSPAVESASYVDLAFRVAMGRDYMTPARVAPLPSREDMVRSAFSVALTDQDRVALQAAKRRAAANMRRPAQAVTLEIDRTLSAVELAKIHGAILGGAARRESPDKVARRLREVVQGRPSLLNDMDRVARTELHDVHAYGALLKLKKQTAAAGITDPMVYKTLSPNSCQHCRRIWQGKRYKLSFIENRVAQGGNYGLPAKQWGPVPGPTHPNCTEGPLQHWNPDLRDAIEAAAAEMRATYGS